MFDFIEEIVHQFKDIPGLSFLRTLHTRLLVTRSRFHRRTEGLRVMRNSIKGTARTVKGIRDKSRSAKRRNEQ